MAAVPRSRRPPKMRDVAALAGVSIATVSRVMHNSPLVDPVTAQRVRAFIEQTNYVPDHTGRALKSGRSGIYGLIVPSLTNPFFSDFVRCFERQMVERGQEMLLALSEHTEVQMLQTIRRLVMRGIDGIALTQAPLGSAAFETLLSKNHVPMVTMNRYRIGNGCSDVAIDPLPGMTEAIAHLLQLGHRQIGFFAGDSQNPGHQARAAGFFAAMRANGLTVSSQNAFFGGVGLVGGERALQLCLRMPAKFSAALCVSDVVAVGALRHLYASGAQPGRDFSIIGLDDTELAQCTWPQLSTIRVDREALTHLFLEALRHFSSPTRRGQQYWLKTSYVRRDSAGRCGSSSAWYRKLRSLRKHQLS